MNCTNTMYDHELDKIVFMGSNRCHLPRHKVEQDKNISFFEKKLIQIFDIYLNAIDRMEERKQFSHLSSKSLKDLGLSQTTLYCEN